MHYFRFLAPTHTSTLHSQLPPTHTHNQAMAPPAQETSEQGTTNRIQEGACLPLDDIKLYAVAKDGSKAEVRFSVC